MDQTRGSSLNNCDHITSIDITLHPNENDSYTVIKRPLKTRSCPVVVFSIIAMEFCERFSFYGLRTILVLYLRNVLTFSDSNSTITFHIFASLCYFTPLIGAILADTLWAKYKTILYLSGIHLVGDSILIFSAITWNYQIISVALVFIGLSMISIGAGGIKPCVGALGGDQFLAHEEKWRDQFFPMLFMSIELGCVVSMFAVPNIRTAFQCVGRSDCYPAAFGATCALMFIAIICFLSARKRYHIIPKPEQSTIVMFFRCIWLASKRRIYVLKETLRSRVKTGNSPASIQREIGCHSKEHWLHLASDKFDKRSISNFICLLSLVSLIFPIQLHYCLFDQQASLWTLQANRMDGRIPGTHFIFDPDQFGLVGPIFTVLAIPVFELGVYPCLAHFGLGTSQIQRMTIGGFCTSFSYVLSAIIENRIDQFQPQSEPPPGKVNLLLINGLKYCSIESPTITYNQVSRYKAFNSSISRIGSIKKVSRINDSIELVETRPIDLLSSSSSLISQYQLSLNLANTELSPINCTYNHDTVQNFIIRPLPEKSVKLLYLMDDRKLEVLMFNESLVLPAAGRARVRLLYEITKNITSSDHEADQFSLVHKASAGHPQASRSSFNWIKSHKLQQVLISDYVDIDVPTGGEKFSIQTKDSDSDFLSSSDAVYLKPATRNLILIKGKEGNSSELTIDHKLLQDNDYRISMLYQLLPYIFISLGNIMLSMTGLAFCYSSAPKGMQPVILGVFYSMNGFGNLLTVIVETVFAFQNEANRFAFYSIFMALAMVLFGYLGYKFKPCKL